MKYFHKTSLLIILFGLFLCVSCSKTTEKYASKEHGMKFGSWTLNYNSGDYDVYWPSLRMSEPVTGNILKIETRSWWDYSTWLTRTVIDTTDLDAKLRAVIHSVKSSHDAQYYSSIRFNICDENLKYWSGQHHFLFNEGQADSVSFSAKANDDGFFIPGRETSDMIVNLLCGHSPVSLTVTYQGSEVDEKYSFTIEGDPRLKKALTINQERKILADKEFKKADAKFEQEIKKFFD